MERNLAAGLFHASASLGGTGRDGSQPHHEDQGERMTTHATPDGRRAHRRAGRADPRRPRRPLPRRDGLLRPLATAGDAWARHCSGAEVAAAVAAVCAAESIEARRAGTVLTARLEAAFAG